jgi:hypothetical protein
MKTFKKRAGNVVKNYAKATFKINTIDFTCKERDLQMQNQFESSDLRNSLFELQIRLISNLRFVHNKVLRNGNHFPYRIRNSVDI